MKVGDHVIRWLAGTVPMKLKVVAVYEDRFECGFHSLRDEDIEVTRETGGLWTFDLRTGAEIDKDLGWGPPTTEEPNKVTGSYIRVSGMNYKQVTVDEETKILHKKFEQIGKDADKRSNN